MSVQQQGPVPETSRRDERREVTREVIVADSGNSSGSLVPAVFARPTGTTLLFGSSQPPQQAPIEMPSEVPINVPDPAGDFGS